MFASSAQAIAPIWRRLRALTRLRPHDTSTVAGRAEERHRRVALTALAAAAAKGISVCTALISVPLTLHYLGTERYGLWMTISSLVTILAFADLGIGNGMVNRIADAHGRDDHHAVRRYVSSGFFVLTLVAFGMLALFSVCWKHVPWSSVFNVQTSLAQQEVGLAVAVFVACFALAMPIGIVSRVQIALQRGFLASMWQCLASTLGLLGVILAIRLEAGLPWLVLAFMGAPLVASTLNSLLFFGRQQKDLAPTRHAVCRVASVQLLRTGGLFLVLQVVVAVAYASDSFIIAQMLGASAVAEYAVPERMFGLITMVIAMVLSPLWPAYSEAIARGDTRWVKRTLFSSFFAATMVGTICSAILVVGGEYIIGYWVGGAITAPFLLLASLGIWKVFEAAGSAVAVFLNGAHVVGIQVVLATLTGVSAVTLKIVLVPKIGVAGAVIATTAAYSVFTVLPLCILLPKILDRLSQHVTPRYA
jgi:O-antigen/teichoic acid export membrane protein